MKRAFLKSIAVAALGGAAAAAPDALSGVGCQNPWQHAAVGAAVGVAALFTEKPKPSPRVTRRGE